MGKKLTLEQAHENLERYTLQVVEAREERDKHQVGSMMRQEWNILHNIYLNKCGNLSSFISKQN